MYNKFVFLCSIITYYCKILYNILLLYNYYGDIINIDHNIKFSI